MRGLLVVLLFSLAACGSSAPAPTVQQEAEVEILSPPAPLIKTDDAYVEASIREVCRRRYSDNVGMWGACKRNARKGLADFESIRLEFQGDEAMAASLARCFDRWTEDGATNFMMIGACARNQREGYLEMGA